MSVRVIYKVDPIVWHRWFAWFPVTVHVERGNGQIIRTRVWREWVYRRYVSSWYELLPEYSLDPEGETDG